MNHLDALYARLRSDPLPHLGRKSALLIQPYTLGYDQARGRHRHPPLLTNALAGGFQSWTESHFHWTTEMGCRQNVAGFALLFADDEPASFDRYFDIYDTFRRETATLSSPPDPTPEAGSMEALSLLQFLDDPHVRQRPRMYFGRTTLDSLRAFATGYFWAERDLALSPSDDEKCFAAFQPWIESRHPFAAGRPWNRTLSFLTLEQDDRAAAAFFDALDLFRAGASPDALSTTARTMLAGINNELRAQSPETPAADLTATLTPIVKSTCPT